MKQIIMPQFGETDQEDIIISRWLKSQGDRIEIGDVIMEIETGKVVTELEAVESGILSRIQRQDGETVKAGDVIGYLDA